MARKCNICEGSSCSNYIVCHINLEDEKQRKLFMVKHNLKASLEKYLDTLSYSQVIELNNLILKFKEKNSQE